MIRESSIISATPLAEKMADSGIVLEPVRVTPLSEMVDEFVALEPSSVSEISSASQHRGLDGKVAHDETMANILETVTTVIENNLKLAQSVVNPIIRTVVEDTDRYVKDQEHAMVNHLSVLPIFHHDIWQNSALRAMVEKYGDTAATRDKIKGVYPSLSVEELLEAVKTGVSRIDEEVQQWIEEIGTEVLTEAYKAVFERLEIGELRVTGDTFYDFLHRRQDRDKVLIAFLIARSFDRNAPEGVPLDKQAHTDYCLTVMEQTARWLCHQYTRDDKVAKTGDLAIYYQNDIIEVDGKNYNAWLAAGGQPEILFGAAITDREINKDALLERKAEYLKAWSRQERIRKIELGNHLISHVTVGLKQAVARQINELSDDDLVVEDRGVYHDRLHAALKGLSEKDVNDLYTLARRIVCDVIFPHTEAKNVLEHIEEVSKREPDLDMREAALIATCNLVTDWICTNIKVVK